MKIIKHREMETVVEYERLYGVKPSQVYFAFKCSEQGVVDSTINPVAYDNYKQCEAGTKVVNGNTMEFLEVKKFEQDVWHNAVGICDKCESKLELVDAMTNTCDCGAEYNGSGQRLEDRRLWDDTDGATSPDYE